MAARNLEDAIEVTLLKHDYEPAFNKLYSKYYYLVYSIALSLTHSTEDAKDVTLEVFAKVWQNRSKLDPGKSFCDYVCEAANNKSIDILRSRKQAFSNRDPDSIASQELNVSSSLSYEDLVTAISYCLTSKESYVFFAHIERDMKFRQIAKVLGISEDAASGIYTRAREKIRRASERADKITKKIIKKTTKRRK